MLEMTNDEKGAYEYALKQYPDKGLFSKRVARILADYINRNIDAQISQVNQVNQVIRADPGSTVRGVKQTVIR